MAICVSVGLLIIGVSQKAVDVVMAQIAQAINKTRLSFALIKILQ